MASTSSGSYVSRYDVFLSFRGETRNNFTDHLYDKLVRAGVYTFRDNDCISRGEDLKPEIERGIKESRASIIVLSEFYATSRWCLDELDLILQQKKERNHFVLPIFYHVDPSHLKNLSGTFEINVRPGSKWTEDKVGRWKAAIQKIGHMAGKIASGPETHVLKEIVDVIKERLDLKQVYRQENLVGMETRDKVINSWLEQSDSEIYAIWGMGGSGKTTLARHITYSNWHKFESVSILEDIGSRCKSTDDLRQLQEILIRDIIEGKEQTNLSGWQGTSTIQNALQRKKSLIVLDNIDSSKQLEALLGTGTKTQSKIIITTTERNQLKWFQSTSWRCQEQEMELLNDSDSLMLLNLYALESNAQTEDYEELAHKLLTYCQGNPLAIKVLGSALNGDRTKEVWESRLRSFMENDLHPEIQELLRISYDSLIPDTVKELFLHISCFFIGEDKDYVVKILEPDYFAISGIVTLTNSCLLSVSPNNKLMMHRLVQEMGRTIVYNESRRLPGKRSRVWQDKESHEVLRKKTGSKKVEGLALDMEILTQENNEIIQISDLDTISFKKMKGLKLLQLNQLKLNGSYEDFPKDLRWLCWRQCHLTEIPSALDMGKLVAIDMSYSKLEVFKPPTVLPLLRILNLKDSHNLSEIKKLNQLPKLETLILWNCQMLLRVCNTIKQLKRLALLNMSGCKDLCKGPRPCIWETMSNSLKQLFLKDCNLEQSEFLSFKTQPLLEYLNMVNSQFEILPSYNHLQKLQVLDLSGCRKLQMLLCLPSKLAELYVSDCDSLERITFESHEFKLNEFRYKGCGNLSEVEDFFKLVPVSKLSETNLGHMKWLRKYQHREVCLVGDGEVTEGRSLCLQMLYEFNIRSISLPDIPNMIPEYAYTSEYQDLSFYVPSCHKNRRLKGLNVTFKYSLSGDEWVWFVKVSLNNVVELIYNAKVFGNPASEEVGIWLSYWEIGESLHIGQKVDVSIVDTKGLRIQGCGASLVYTDEEEEDESIKDSPDFVVDNNDSFEYNNESFEDARESFEDNNEGEDILRVDISRYKISPRTYYLCRRDYCQLMEVGRLTHNWFKILVGDKIDCTEVGGWTKTGRPEQASQLFTKPKSEEASTSSGLFKSFLGDKNVEVKPSTSNATINSTVDNILSNFDFQGESAILQFWESSTPGELDNRGYSLRLTDQLSVSDVHHDKLVEYRKTCLNDRSRFVGENTKVGNWFTGLAAQTGVADYQHNVEASGMGQLVVPVYFELMGPDKLVGIIELVTIPPKESYADDFNQIQSLLMKENLKSTYMGKMIKVRYNGNMIRFTLPFSAKLQDLQNQMVLRFNELENITFSIKYVDTNSNHHPILSDEDLQVCIAESISKATKVIRMFVERVVG